MKRILDEEKVFKDPVHGYIYVNDPLIWDLINTKEMQRLRRIRQLGTSYVTYPGGEHSRFSHSLGVYEVIRQIVQAFARNAYEWPTEYNQLVMVAGLLHDIGHAPFSHALEKVIGLRHEVWSERIILEPTTEVHQVLEQMDPALPSQVASVINKTHPQKLVVSLVSGQLDADRLDYLMRDSIFTGVDYGKFDLARIIRVMRPLGGRIVVKRSGLHTVEAYLLARYFMYWQVYFHPVSRSAEVILKAILKRVKDLVACGQAPPMPHPALAELFTQSLRLDSYFALDDTVLFNAFNVWQDSSDPILKDLCRRFLNRHLFTYIEYPDHDIDTYQKLRTQVQSHGYDPAYYLAVDETGTVYYDYYLGAENSEDKDSALFLWDDDKKALIEMSRLSKPVNAIAREKQVIRRLYFPHDVR
ncbi:HD domain-containing protein [Sulfobacillus thermosulfidooxidans]|uniref:HD domain-containing protein n=1 Tax=Sulfobacillus thermosulfidooxidans TaxID=28034 RepID=UPI000A8E6D2A|nr:HD domain-containing protein [Sulfobacillus thermosulfidooxidans]